MDKVSDLIGRVLRKRGLLGEAEASYAAHLANLWIASALPAIAPSAKAAAVRDGVLIVECEHPLAASKISEKAQELLLHLQSKLSSEIKKVRPVRSKSASN